MTTPRRSLSKPEMLAMFIRQEFKTVALSAYELMKDQPGYDGKPNKLFTRECHENITRTEDLPRIVKARHQAGGKGSQIAKRKNKSYRPIKSRNSLTKEEREKARKWKQILAREN